MKLVNIDLQIKCQGYRLKKEPDLSGAMCIGVASGFIVYMKNGMTYFQIDVGDDKTEWAWLRIPHQQWRTIEP